jgi:Flp pilus assembly protein TadG
VEFALVLPILMMFILGIVEFGRGYNAKIELTAAVREGARAAALGGDVPGAQTATVNGAPALKPALAAGQVNVTLCPATLPAAGANATVTASYAFTYTIPFVTTQTKNLTATGVMRCSD